jgi:hypothetical protein
MSRPVAFQWDGEVMKPAHPGIADREYVVGERYMLAPFEQRSQASHSHEFAWLHEAWLNLPERLAAQFPSSEHLRKYALIQVGYSNSQSHVCASRAEALRLAAFIRPIDEFAVVTVNGNVVNHFTAKSQSRRAMGKAEFQDSKTRIMDFIAAMIGIEPATLAREAGRAA